MKKPRKSPVKKIAEKQAEMRKQIFGDIDDADIWYRKTANGFTTMPRSMPLIGALMDGLSGKGKPISTTYLELWCRSNDFGFVTMSKQLEIACASGFSGQRGVSTWKERVRRLEELGFIETKPGISGALHYAQIWNPYTVIKRHKVEKTAGFQQDKYSVLLERALEIGAVDLSD